ncbi:MAG TPA: phosphoglyceromutase [Frankiaceae bacterium]|nr:phosphoglyceromutase [Frankiaceae bacterium]
MPTLVLLRHGESDWNKKNLFTGWVDVDLSDDGVEEARRGGRLLAEQSVLPEVMHTSLLTRAIRTSTLALEECERVWIPVRRSWRLNERHYGALQGLNKGETREKYGDEQFTTWRRSYDTPPPPIEDDQESGVDERYDLLPSDLLPKTECLKDVLERMLPYWYDAVVPDLRAGSVTLVVAHGNSLRALVKHLDGIDDDSISGLNIPTGIPLRYELDDDLKSTGNFDAALGVSGIYLDPDLAREKSAAVASQGSGPK